MRVAAAPRLQPVSRAGHPLRQLLALAGFRRLMAVRLLGQGADGVFQAALFSAVFFNPDRATSAGQAAGAFATLLLPYSVVGPFAGVFLDRWSRQRVLAWGNLLRGSTVVAFAALLAASGPTSAPVVALALVLVSVNRFVLSGLSAALPHVVPDRLLVTANSVSTTAGAGAAAVGGVSAVALRTVLGTGDTGAAWTAVGGAVVYGLAAAAASGIRRDALGPDAPPAAARLLAAMVAVARGVGQGAQHVRSRPATAHALAAITAHRFFYGLSFVATLLLYTAHGAIGRGVGGLGEVVAAAVLGGLVAAAVTPAVSRRIGMQPWVVTVFASAAAVELAFGLPYTHPAVLVAALGLGFAAQAAKICVDTLVQESVADEFRGRVFSFYDTLFNVSFVAAAGAAAVLIPPDGKSYPTLVLVAVGYALTAAGYGVATARRARARPATAAGERAGGGPPDTAPDVPLRAPGR